MAVSDCLFCKIVQKEIDSEFVYEDDQCIAIKDIAPATPTHLLIIPKKHIPSLDQVEIDDSALLGHMQLVAARLARQQGIADQGYRLLSNCGEGGGQAIFHLHYHLMGGKKLGWPPE